MRSRRESSRPGRYRATNGTGTLAFLKEHSYRLGFEHINGELTATLDGTCNAFSPILEIDGKRVVAIPGASTAVGCLGPDGGWDNALSRFFDGVLTYRISGDTLTFSSRMATAVFQHQ
jgi:heat shock protein HslJ